MKRITTMATILAILVLGPAAAVVAGPPPALVWPDSGQPGGRVTVDTYGFTSGSTFEVHGGDFDGPLLGTAANDGDGHGSVEITIPSGVAVGEYTLAVCEVTYVACTDTWSDFWIGATTVFTVEPPPPTTTGIPLVILGPDSGEAGSSSMVSISGFTPDSRFEVHIGDYSTGPIGSGATDAIGEAEVSIVIPATAEAGALTVGVCETQFVLCTDTWSDFWVGGSATFDVAAPPPPPSTTTTTTVAPTTTTAAPTTTTAAPPSTVAAATPVPTTIAATPTDDGVVALPAIPESTHRSALVFWLVALITFLAVLWFALAWRQRRSN